MNGIIQVAGVKSLAEATMLLDCGADLIGYPLRLDVHHEDTSEAEAARIIARSAPEKSVLITYLDQADAVIEFMDFLKVKWVQLHGKISLAELQKLRRARPDLIMIKSLVIHPDNSGQLEELIHYSWELVDYYITDTFDPATGASGATGKTHDWQISRDLVEISPKPVILAGGLNGANVAQAIQTVQPFGVDAHTGVEDEKGDKDRSRVESFINNARAAFGQIHSGLPYEPAITDELDLHTFQPKEVKSLVPEYLAAAHQKGYRRVRIIHGRGTGVLRAIVQSLLADHPLVEYYKTADEAGGNWGATIVGLKEFPGQ